MNLEKKDHCFVWRTTLRKKDDVCLLISFLNAELKAHQASTHSKLVLTQRIVSIKILLFHTMLKEGKDVNKMNKPKTCVLNSDFYFRLKLGYFMELNY